MVDWKKLWYQHEWSNENRWNIKIVQIYAHKCVIVADTVDYVQWYDAD